jgi:hypothetical protein
MTAVLALGCFGTGFAVAWILRTAFKMAEMSWWQERMQRKVRYWQGQAIHARAVAEWLIGQLALVTGQEPVVPDWPQSTATAEEEWSQ